MPNIIWQIKSIRDRDLRIAQKLFKYYSSKTFKTFSANIEQAGFHPNKSTIGQLLNLTQHIEDGYQKKKITGAVFVDLTAAYDTVTIVFFSKKY